MKLRGYLRLGAALTSLACGHAYAQSVGAVTESDRAAEEQLNQAIIVTGTRIVSDGFEAPTPVTVITQAQINQAAPVTIADFVNQLPALLGGETPRTPRGNLAAGTAGANFLNLRNLGANRTLVMMNGRRVTPSNITGNTDINVLPSALVTRVDVVTGGASAAWGSDAVAGVVNFVTDTKFTGLKGTVQGGTTIEGDGESYSGDLTFGLAGADDRLHVIVSGQYSKTFEAYAKDRDWFKANKIVANPAFVAGNGQPARLVVPYTSLLVTDNGLIASGPLRGTFFDASGNVAGNNFAFPPTISGIFGGGSEQVYNTLTDQSRYAQVNVPLENGSIYGRMSYDIGDVTAFVEASWSKASTETTIANFFRAGNTSIGISNFFVTPALRTAMTTAGVTSVPLSTSNAKLGILRSAIERENTRFLGGFEGRIGSSWRYALTFQRGETDVRIRSPNNFLTANYARAVDAVANPTNPTQAICRSTLTNPTDGCVAINPFGSQPLNDAQRAYVLGNSTQDLLYRQDVATASINGDVFDLPAGALSFAGGLEYRTEKASAVSDGLSTAGSPYFAGNYKPFTGRYTVKEGFAEVGIPVFKDSALGTSLNLDLAVRLTDYSTSGSVTTWKAGAIYKPIEDLEVRVTRSRDIRAPNLNELFQTGIVGTQNVSDPFNGGANVQFQQTTRGNLGLNPEKADTLTAGVVFRPQFLPGLGLSIDFYDIKLKQAIAINSSQFTVNRCFAGDTVLCNTITRNGAGLITAITLQPFNALSERARGVDFEANYRTDLGAGSLELRALLNYTAKLDIITATNTISRAGEVGNNVGAGEGVPSWRGLFTAAYKTGPFTGQIKSRFIGASKFDKQWTGADVNLNHVPAIVYFDAYASYKLDVGKGAEVFIAGDNILNKAPPVVTNQDNSNLLSVGTNPFVYDVLGATIRGGVRFSF